MKKSIIRLSLLVAAFVAAAFVRELPANAGDLYSGQLTFNQVDKFTPSGVRLTFVSGFFADALAFDAQDNLFVADPQSHQIHKVTPAGVATTFAAVTNPMGLAFDAAGNLFVADAATGAAGTGSVIKFTPAGASTMFATGLNGPFGLAFDTNGNLFVSETNTTSINGRILKFAPNGTSTTFAMGLNSPEGLAFDSAGNLYEADFGSGNIFKFTPGGTKSTFTTFVAGPSPGVSLGPRHIAFDSGGNLFVALSVTQQIVKVTPAAVQSVFAETANPGGLAFESATVTLANISTRALVQTGNNVLIGGFVISGTGGKKVLIRGIGPSLPAVVPNRMQDPMISLHDSTTAEIASNDNWQTDPNASQIPMPLQPGDPRDAAILTTLQPGGYTAIVSGAGGTTGVALVEVYDMDPAATSQLANISTRGLVQTGDFVMIGGFVATGTASIDVLIRARGPSLAGAGIANTLPDPTVSVIDAQGMVVGFNDNWRDTQEAQIQATGQAPTNDLESAILVSLAPAGYTAIVKDKNGASGIGIVEVFNVR